MKSKYSASRMAVRGLFCELVRISKKARGSAAVAIFCLCVLILGVVCLTVVRSAQATPGQPQGSSGCGSGFTSFDAPDAGKSVLQGTGGVSINDTGDIAGFYVTAPNVSHGYVRLAATGIVTEFDAPNAGTGLNQGTIPVSINAGGDIAGIYIDTNVALHGFVRHAATGTITEFDVPGAPTNTKHRGTAPLSINTAGEITGMYEGGDTVRHGFLRAADGSFTTFDAPGAGSGAIQGTIPLSVNTGGSVAGFYLDANQLSHGFVRAANGTITAIDAPNASTAGKSKKGFNFSGTIAEAIDTAGDIVGIYADANFVYHGFVRAAGGTITEFDAPGAGAGLFPGTVPTSINSTGDVAGFYSDAGGANHGFLRAAASGAITAPLDAPGAATTGMLNGTVPFSINTADDLTGLYFDTSGVVHAFLLTTASQTSSPTFSPAAGTYTSPQKVTISDATAGAAIFYTTDGTPPTTSSTQYTGPITISSTVTIKAIAVASGCSSSAITSAKYVINPTPDFQVTVSPTTLTIVAGNSGTATFTVTPQNGFNSPVNFSCSGLPSEAACSFSPTSVTPNGTAVTSTLTVTTTKSTARTGPLLPSHLPIYAVLFPALAMLLGISRNGKRRGRELRVLSWLGLLLMVSALTSCSGGGSSKTGNPGTPAGTSSVSVSASAAGGGAVSHTATLTITVTQ